MRRATVAPAPAGRRRCTGRAARRGFTAIPSTAAAESAAGERELLHQRRLADTLRADDHQPFAGRPRDLFVASPHTTSSDVGLRRG
jgi:hypothetical protein